MSMFTRNSSEPAPFDPLKPIAKADPSSPPQLRRTEFSEAGKSVISNDLKIIGQGLKIISRGTLQVDGEVEGDVAAAHDHSLGGHGARHLGRRASDRARQDLRRHSRDDCDAASLGTRGR